jgi:hypothetical protein
VLVDGERYAIGPGDGEYAAAQTGVDGTLVIATGYANTDQSDKPDVFAPPLRVWASFMDPFERILVYPDREFHKRVATAQAVTDPPHPDYADPDVVNLQTSHSYSDAQLFSDQEKQQDQPRNIANAIQTMNKSVGTGGLATPAPPRSAG